MSDEEKEKIIAKLTRILEREQAKAIKKAEKEARMAANKGKRFSFNKLIPNIICIDYGAVAIIGIDGYLCFSQGRIWNDLNLEIGLSLHAHLGVMVGRTDRVEPSLLPVAGGVWVGVGVQGAAAGHTEMYGIGVGLGFQASVLAL